MELAKQVAELSAAVTRQATRMEDLTSRATLAAGAAGAPDVAALRAENQKLQVLNDQIASERDRLWQALSASMSGERRMIDTPARRQVKARRWWQFWQVDESTANEPPPAAAPRAATEVDRDYQDLEHLTNDLDQVSRTLQNIALQSVFLGNDDEATDLIEQAAGLCHRAVARLQESARRGLGVTILQR